MHVTAVQQAQGIEATEPHATLCHQPCRLCSFINVQTGRRHHQVITWEHLSCKCLPGCNPFLLDNIRIPWWKGSSGLALADTCIENIAGFSIAPWRKSLPAHFSHVYFKDIFSIQSSFSEVFVKDGRKARACKAGYSCSHPCVMTLDLFALSLLEKHVFVFLFRKVFNCASF